MSKAAAQEVPPSATNFECESFFRCFQNRESISQSRALRGATLHVVPVPLYLWFCLGVFWLGAAETKSPDSSRRLGCIRSFLLRHLGLSRRGLFGRRHHPFQRRTS